jgi:hypothetical protein
VPLAWQLDDFASFHSSPRLIVTLFLAAKSQSRPDHSKIYRAVAQMRDPTENRLTGRSQSARPFTRA